MDKDARIYVAGHRGLVGSAIWNNLQSKGYTQLTGRTHTELDLLDSLAVRRFFDTEEPEYVFLAAAHVGGIMANNTYRADFIYQNLQIQQNIIGESFRHGVKKLLFLGSTCIYPRDIPQPMKEDALLTAPLEYTNEPYAIAKIAGLKLCESFNLQYGTNYIAVMPTNLYGPNDNFHLENSHVLPAMIRKIHLARCLAENNWPAYYSMEHYKVARYYMADEHSRVPEVQLASGRTWDALPEEYRQTLQACARASAQYERQLWAQEETAARKAALAGGCRELPLPEEEMQNFRQLVQPLYQKHCADYLPLVEEIQAE